MSALPLSHNYHSYLHPDFIIGVSLVPDAVCDRVDDVDLQEVGRRRVRVVQRLLLAAQPLRGVLAGHFSKIVLKKIDTSAI